MRILAIETTGPVCSAAVLDDDGQITEMKNTEKMNHLRSLAPMIKELTEKTGIPLKEFDRIAVSVGPGSFTGIRIGVSTARALSQLTGVSLTAVPTLPAFGLGECRSAGDADLVCCPVFDARRSQVYAGAYRNMEEIVTGMPYMLDEFLEKLKGNGKIRFAGDGVIRYGGLIKRWTDENGIRTEFSDTVQTAAYVAECALDMEESGGFEDSCGLSYNELEPNYMRKPEAERRLEEKKKAGAGK